jgi:hypothetical protein
MTIPEWTMLQICAEENATSSPLQRDAALPHWLHLYQHQSADSALGSQPPITG